MRPIAEAQRVDRASFERDILPAAKPVVMRGLVRDWPLVNAEDPLAYLGRFATGANVRAIRADAREQGRFHYREDMTGFNFENAQLPLPVFFDFLAKEAKAAEPSALAVQAIPIAAQLPGLQRENEMPLLSSTQSPNIWIGSAAKIATHQDAEENIACVAVGRRRFTLFPPEAIASLYIGPIEHTPAGTPISMVHVTAPDHARYPKFAEALAVSQTADLEPGDAIFIPYHWWHHVESLDRVGILVNYWWNDSDWSGALPIEAMFHAIAAVRDLPDHHRTALRAAFDYYVFASHGATHLPPHCRGILGDLSPQQRANLRRELGERLRR